MWSCRNLKADRLLPAVDGSKLQCDVPIRRVRVVSVLENTEFRSRRTARQFRHVHQFLPKQRWRIAVAQGACDRLKDEDRELPDIDVRRCLVDQVLDLGFAQLVALMHVDVSRTSKKLLSQGRV